MLSRMAERDHQSLALSPPEFPYMRNWCVIGALNRDLGIVPGQIDTFGIPPGEYYASARSQSCLMRPDVPIPTAPQRELPLSNSMGQLDADQGNSRSPERLEASHRDASAFDGTGALGA